MKKIFLIILFIFMVFLGRTESNACNGPVSTAPHSDCSNKIYEDRGNGEHRIWCCCGKNYNPIDDAEHTGGTATCTSRKKCTLCKAYYGSYGSHSWQWSSTYHRKKCKNCDAEEWHNADFKYYSDKQEICDEGDCLVKQPHQLNDYKDINGTQHYQTCSTGKCSGYEFNVGNHAVGDTGTPATCQAKAVCGTCKLSYGSLAAHNYNQNTTCSYIKKCQWCSLTSGSHSAASTWSKDGTYHWKVCGGGCGTIVVAKAKHDGGSATCQAKAICSTSGCGERYGSLASHNYTQNTTCSYIKKCQWCSATSGSHSESAWALSSTTGKHNKVCISCKIVISEHSPAFSYLNATQEKCSVCGLTQGHNLSGWINGGTYHYKTCSRCSGYTFEKNDHTGGVATCIAAGKCVTCKFDYIPALGHTGGTPECEGTKKKAVCTRCSTAYGNLVDHNYSKSCTATHCSVKLCKWCGKHNGTCGGGCNSTTCTHCKYQFCSRCETHTAKVSCPCDQRMSCSDKHCAGAKWCSMCGTHTCTPCNTNRECPEPHCTQGTCSVCYKNHQGTCGGGHKYSWVTNTPNNQTQTHTNKCNVTSTCEATNGSHNGNWGRANTKHISTCQNCPLTYDHSDKPKWSTEQPENGTDNHPCLWGVGCDATHVPSWGAYYKLGGGKDGDTNDKNHTRTCSICKVNEQEHLDYGAWSWLDATKHIRECKVCKLTQTLNHNFELKVKDVDLIEYSELYKHWKICKTCSSDLSSKVDELHQDDGHGNCKCGQILWKAIAVKNGEDITGKIRYEDSSRKRPATREETIKIVEVVDNNGAPKIQYIQNLTGDNSDVVASNNILSIVENGEYEFITGRDGTVTIIILNISRKILIDKIINPVTSTTGKVTIIIRTNKAEEQYEKYTYIKEGNSKVTDSELGNGKKLYEITKDVYQNGEYLFSARDTAGNEKIIRIVIDNIIKGQATVAISNDVFRRGYVFTEILVNPNKEWSATGNAKDIVNASVYQIGSKTPTTLDNNDIKIVKVMDMQRNEVKKNSNTNTYLPGAYYIQVAIGGKIFENKGTYIIDLENVNLTGGVSLAGKNRIIVEVQDLQDLT